MVCIVETEITSSPSQLSRCQALERGLGCNWHEHREQHGAMGERKDRSAGFGGLLSTYRGSAFEQWTRQSFVAKKMLDEWKRCLTDRAFGNNLEFERWRFGGYGHGSTTMSFTLQEMDGRESSYFCMCFVSLLRSCCERASISLRTEDQDTDHFAMSRLWNTTNTIRQSTTKLQNSFRIKDWATESFVEKKVPCVVEGSGSQEGYIDVLVRVGLGNRLSLLGFILVDESCFEAASVGAFMAEMKQKVCDFSSHDFLPKVRGRIRRMDERAKRRRAYPPSRQISSVQYNIEYTMVSHCRIQKKLL